MTRLELLKIAKPIPFNVEMVRAIQDSKKTVTRRKVKPQPPKEANGIYERMDNGNFQLKLAPYTTIYDYEIKPPYEIGDYLYVQETWSEDKHNYLYQAEFSDADLKKLKNIMRWGSPDCMPRNAARIFLRVTDIRVERLQDISADECISEGVEVEIPPICKRELPTEEQQQKYNNMTEKQREQYVNVLARHTYMGWCVYVDEIISKFRKIWNSTVKKSDLYLYGWDANPWVLVISFERVEVE